ncbi:hypothetical protein NQ314_019042 [Rhamnusium bicolor]|uniref:Leucine-rich repeat-containing protein 23 n=1 Tax=Rhamnusium bicolor TaxID=1586634 RepID=A0AAV8WQF0_9CUCU|nr:hypothetical protein NQ314_019042 [Rhamnusium bicolor]
MDEQLGEGGALRGEGGPTVPSTPHFIVEEPIKDKKLSFEEASASLNTLGKDESGVRYAYLMISANEKKLTDVAIILNFKHVLFVDLSGNFLNLDALQVLSGMPFMIFLRADRNRIESAALSPMPYLQVLILNKNQITETCDINQPMLEYLELEDNLIYTAQFDTEHLSGTYPCSLEKLYLAQNRISKFTMDFSTLNNLKVLHLRENNIRKLNGFTEELENLTYLNLRGNKINKVRQFRKLMCLPNLETLIILENPVCGVEEEKPKDEEIDEEEVFGEDELPPRDITRIPLLVLLPNLKRINKEIVALEEREEAEMGKRKISEQIFEELSSEDETEAPTTTGFTTEYTTETEIDKNDYEWETDIEEMGNPRENPKDKLGPIKEETSKSIGWELCCN